MFLLRPRSWLDEGVVRRGRKRWVGGERSWLELTGDDSEEGQRETVDEVRHAAGGDGVRSIGLPPQYIQDFSMNLASLVLAGQATGSMWGSG